MNKVFSFWERKLYEDLFDFVIIGGGLTGLSAAIHLKIHHPRKRILLMERGVLPYGASTKNAGFACFGTVGELEDDRNNRSFEEVLETVEMRNSGLRLLRSLANDAYTAYDSCGGVELYKSEQEFEKAYAQMDFWNRALTDVVGLNVFEVIENKLPGFCKRAIKNNFEGALNPSKAVHSLWIQAQILGIEFLCGTELHSYEEKSDHVLLKSSLDIELKTSQLLFCTNAFSTQLLPSLDIVPARNQVLITKPLDVNPLDSCYHFDKGYVYFRAVGNRILLGGARNISSHEHTAEYGNTDEIKQHLQQFLVNHIAPDAEIDYWWSGIIATGSAKKPLIAKSTDKISFGLRLSGMGVAIGTFVGKQLAELHR